MGRWDAPTADHGRWGRGTTCLPGEGPVSTRAASHLPSARFMPASASLRGSAGPLPARRRFCFKRQSASSAAAAEPEEDESEAAQRSCSKVTGSVRFLIPRPCRPAVLGALASPARPPAPPWPQSPPRTAVTAGSPEPTARHIPAQAAAPAMDQRRRPVGHRGQSAQDSRQLRPPRHAPITSPLVPRAASPESPAPTTAILEKGRRSSSFGSLSGQG